MKESLDDSINSHLLPNHNTGTGIGAGVRINDKNSTKNNITNYKNKHEQSEILYEQEVLSVRSFEELQYADLLCGAGTGMDLGSEKNKLKSKDNKNFVTSQSSKIKIKIIHKNDKIENGEEKPKNYTDDYAKYSNELWITGNIPNRAEVDSFSDNKTASFKARFETEINCQDTKSLNDDYYMDNMIPFFSKNFLTGIDVRKPSTSQTKISPFVEREYSVTNEDFTLLTFECGGDAFPSLHHSRIHTHKFAFSVNN